MNFIKTMMMCVLLTPTLCWGGKFEGLLGVLSHARAPMVRASQVGAARGVDMLQNRQFHGSAALCVRNSPTELDPQTLSGERHKYESNRLEGLLDQKAESRKKVKELASSTSSPQQKNKTIVEPKSDESLRSELECWNYSLERRIEVILKKRQDEQRMKENEEWQHRFNKQNLQMEMDKNAQLRKRLAELEEQTLPSDEIWSVKEVFVITTAPFMAVVMLGVFQSLTGSIGS